MEPDGDQARVAPVTPTDTSDQAVVDSEPTRLDLDALAGELADVEIALARLEAGTYFTDEVTGEELAESFLEQHPTARTLPRS